jgi:hypothetical protein
MGKFDDLENKLDKVVKKASLKSKKDKSAKNILIYNVPVEWTEILKEKGIPFSSYAKMAVLEKMKKDGLM